MKEFEPIAFRELEKYAGKNGCIIIDLRTRKMFEESHVKGAWNIPYERLWQAASMLPKHRLLLLYCERGGTAMRAGKELAEKGFRVKAAIGGFEGNRRTD